MHTKKVHHITLPGLGRFAVVRDAGEARFAHGVILGTHLAAKHFRKGRLYDCYDLGSGVVTIGWVNTMVSDAVTGTSVVPTLARYKFMASGTGTTAATDGDTALQTEVGTRATATLSNAQSATTGNHLAKLQYLGTNTFTTTNAVTEFGLFDASSVGNLADHRVFAALNVVNGDAIQYTYTLSLPSNG